MALYELRGINARLEQFSTGTIVGGSDALKTDDGDTSYAVRNLPDYQSMEVLCDFEPLPADKTLATDPYWATQGYYVQLVYRYIDPQNGQSLDAGASFIAVRNASTGNQTQVFNGGQMNTASSSTYNTIGGGPRNPRSSFSEGWLGFDSYIGANDIKTPGAVRGIMSFSDGGADGHYEVRITKMSLFVVVEDAPTPIDPTGATVPATIQRKPPSQRDQPYALQRQGRAIQSMVPGSRDGRVANAELQRKSFGDAGGGGGGSSVSDPLLFVGPENPTDASLFWYDTDAVCGSNESPDTGSTSGGRTDVLHIGPDAPLDKSVFWYDTDAACS